MKNCGIFITSTQRYCSFTLWYQTCKLQMDTQDQDSIWWICWAVQSSFYSLWIFIRIWHWLWRTFTSIAKITSICSLIDVALARKGPLYQINIKNVVLHGDLSEVVYMQPPLGVSSPPSYFCRLCYPIYGLKQASRAWFERFRQSLLSTHYTKSSTDYVIFYHASPRSIFILIIYVDDMIITRRDPAAIASQKKYL